jgi:predicted phosphodiesterase
MPQINTIKAQITKEYIKKYPKLSRAALSRLLVKDHPLVFNSVEEARTRIRYYTGQTGEKHRKHLIDKSLIEPSRTSSRFEFLPKSYAVDYAPHQINQSKILIISDLHFPYQDNKAIELALQYGLDKDVNCILINGDLLDFATISRHEKDWRHRQVHDEFEAVRSFLVGLRGLFPKSKIVFKEGNHDERWEKWLFLKAPEIFDDPEFTLQSRLRLGELMIDYVRDKRPVQIGKLTILHGHELAGGSGGVNPARSTFLKTLDSVLVGHYHKRSSHDETTMNGNVISVQSQGCLCGMNPLFMPINKWQQGFSYVEHDIKTGDYLLHNHVIIKGKVY